MTKPSFAQGVLDHHWTLRPNIEIPPDVQWLYPYDDPEVKRVMELFFTKYFSDSEVRVALFGINPGRFGAGVTGTPFTDPIRLEEVCGISNQFKKRQELSSVFVYDVIASLGGPKPFYSNFYLTSISPLGFIKGGKNYNYYDDGGLKNRVMPLIEFNIEKHLELGVSREIAFSMGQGKNFAFLQALNDHKKYFKEVRPLPHPRWVMQYRLKRKEEYIRKYVNELSRYMNE